jgi:hypothetical protein
MLPGLIFVMIALVLLDLLALEYGVDSRDGADWNTPPPGTEKGEMTMIVPMMYRLDPTREDGRLLRSSERTYPRRPAKRIRRGR